MHKAFAWHTQERNLKAVSEDYIHGREHFLQIVSIINSEVRAKKKAGSFQLWTWVTVPERQKKVKVADYFAMISFEVTCHCLDKFLGATFTKIFLIANNFKYWDW